MWDRRAPAEPVSMDRLHERSICPDPPGASKQPQLQIILYGDYARAREGRLTADCSGFGLGRGDLVL
jgi:hypothetical protein